MEGVKPGGNKNLLAEILRYVRHHTRRVTSGGRKNLQRDEIGSTLTDQSDVQARIVDLESKVITEQKSLAATYLDKWRVMSWDMFVEDNSKGEKVES